MKKIIFIKFFILLIFVKGCGYTPIFSNKNINFTIVFDGKMEGTFTDDYVNHSSLDYMDNVKVM